jgi:hypothetical protein
LCNWRAPLGDRDDFRENQIAEIFNDANLLQRSAIIFMVFLRRRRNFIILAFWYISLFPGRIGYDNLEALRIIKQGDSTNWWTSQYFWLLKVSSIDGRAIFLTSLLSLTLGFYAVKRFIQEFRLIPEFQEKVITFSVIFPIIPVFFLTISHDAFACAGFILLSAQLVKRHKWSEPLLRREFIEIALALILLMTTYSGQVVGLILLITFVLLNRKLQSFALLSMMLSIVILTSFGVQQTIPKEKYMWPLIADLKCVVQHPGADVKPADWIFLEKLADKKSWQEQVSCKLMDDAVGILRPDSLRAISKLELLKVYFNIAFSNPQIVIMAHLQKNRNLLPPPFFLPPENMISWDANKPVGEGTDSSLQTQYEVLHISIDSLEYAKDISFVKPLEAIALLPVFFINQASWFWGWAGMWLLFIFVRPFNSASFKGIPIFVLPLLLLSAVLLIVNPVSSARYVMPIIILGQINALFLIFRIRSKSAGETNGNHFSEKYSQ